MFWENSRRRGLRISSRPRLREKLFTNLYHDMVNMVSEDASVTDILAKLLPKLKDTWETRKTSSCQCVSTVSTLQPHLWSFLKAVWGLHRNDPTLCSVSPGPFATSPLRFLSFGHTQPKQTSKRTHNTKKSGPKSLHLLPLGFGGITREPKRRRCRGVHGEIARYGALEAESLHTGIVSFKSPILPQKDVQF